jgi:pimeloyl-ACP methyl ester carboxylesterase
MMGSARDRMLEGVPVTERRLPLAGVSTVVLEGGDGPPVVLLHGAIESGGAYWAPVIERLAEHHRFVVPDVPGLGESEPVADLTADAFAEWFRALLRETCDDRPTLVGHSMGGSLAARYAVQHGESLSRLVIYAGTGVGPYRIPVGLALRAIMFGLRPSEKNADRLDDYGFFDLDAARRRDGEWLEAWSLYARERATVPHVKRTMRRLIQRGKKQVPEAELRRIAIPASLIYTSHDRFVPLSVAQWASARLRWPLRVIDEAGHVPHIERPEVFCDELQTRLRHRVPSMGGPGGASALRGEAAGAGGS